jgi:hypothetical protein
MLLVGELPALDGFLDSTAQDHLLGDRRSGGFHRRIKPITAPAERRKRTGIASRSSARRVTSSSTRSAHTNTLPHASIAYEGRWVPPGHR